MRRPRSLPLPGFLCAALLCCAASGPPPAAGAPARKEYEVHFFLGCQAFDKGQWEQVIPKMREARKLQPDGSTNDNRKVRYTSSRHILYRPSVYIGVALCGCEKACDPAVDDLRRWTALGHRVDSDAYLAGCDSLIRPKCQEPCRQILERFRGTVAAGDAPGAEVPGDEAAGDEAAEGAER